MPIPKKWSRASKQRIARDVPESSGVYELKAFGKLVYVGKASNLRSRLLTHLRDRNPNYYRYETVGFLGSPSRLEGKHLRAYGSTEEEMPPWNQRVPPA